MRVAWKRWLLLIALMGVTGRLLADGSFPLYDNVQDGKVMAAAMPYNTSVVLYINQTGLNLTCKKTLELLKKMAQQPEFKDIENIGQYMAMGDLILNGAQRLVQALDIQQIHTAVAFPRRMKDVDAVLAIRFGHSISDQELENALKNAFPMLSELTVRDSMISIAKDAPPFPLTWRAKRRVLLLGTPKALQSVLEKIKNRKPSTFPDEAISMVNWKMFGVLLVNRPDIQKAAAAIPNLSANALGFHLPIAISSSMDEEVSTTMMAFPAERDAAKANAILNNLGGMWKAFLNKQLTSGILDEEEVRPYKEQIVELIKLSQKVTYTAEGTRVTCQAPSSSASFVPAVGVGAAILLPALSKAREKARAISCISNMKMIGTALVMYADDNNGKFPSADKWQEALKEYLGGNDKIMTCPSGATYVYYGGGVKTSQIKSPASTVILSENMPLHNGVYNLLFADGHVQSVKAEDSFEETLEKNGFTLPKAKSDNKQQK